LAAFTDSEDAGETPTVVDYLEYGMSEEVGAHSGYRRLKIERRGM